MSARNVLILLALVAAALAASFVRWSPQTAPLTQLQRPQRGYYLEDATITGAGPTGAPVYSMHAVRIEQDLDEDTARLTDISLDYRAGTTPWSLRADSGAVSADGQHITLAGNVVIVERSGEGGDPVLFTTATLAVDVGTHTARTPDPVRVQRGAHLMDAVGLAAFLSEDRVQLQSDVHAVFHP